MTTSKLECSACAVVVGFCFAMEKAEAKRLERKVAAVAGWLVVGNDAHCPDCSSALRLALSRMSRDQARQVQSALADALHYARCEVVGV